MASTIKDVARRAGVGIATVSRVINGSPNVLPSTRDRVLEAIDELNYFPNQAARQLVTARTFTIGVVLPFLTRPFFVEVLRGIEAEVAQSDYQLIIFNVESSVLRERYFGTLPFLGRLDGLIVVSMPLIMSEVGRLRSAQLPVVMVDCAVDGLRSIVVNNIAGAETAVEHLLTLGHRRIAYVCGPLEHELGLTINQQRLKGYRQALQRHNLPVQSAYIRANQDGRDAGRYSAHQLLGLPTPPTAIFAASDELAFGCMDAIRERGLEVGKDLAVIGYDDLELAEYLQLSTIRQPMEQMGREAAQALFELLDDPATPPEHSFVPTTLKARQSTLG